MAAKIHTWLFGLIYPAFLGAVLVNLFSSGLPWPTSEQSAWALALTIYFLTQFGEGIAAKDDYATETAVFDLFEVAAMVFAFFWLRSLSVQSVEAPVWLLVKLGVSVALILPPVKRWCLRREVNTLSLLSIGALFLTWLPGPFGAWAFAAPLAFYLIALLLSDSFSWVEKPLIKGKAALTAAG